MKTMKKERPGKILILSLVLISLCLWGCSDDEDSKSSYNPATPVKITSFTPEKGGARTQLLIYGENFGSDLSLINVTVGGIQAKVVGSNGECIYCMVPPLAFDGTIVITIGTEETGIQTVTADSRFNYERKSLVGTLCGYIDEQGNYKVEDGPFEKAGFDKPNWFLLDPQNPNHLYVSEEGYGIRLVDIEKEEVSTVVTLGQMSINRARAIDWTPDGDMVVSNDQGSENGISTVLLKRSEGFMRATTMTWSKSCNGIAVHPVNGEYYFTQWQGGSIHRFDPKVDKTHRELFKVWANEFEITPIFHPTGNYAYLVIMNRDAIVKSMYDWNKKELGVPQPFAGNYDANGWVDGVGVMARMDTPWQGVFVKNEEYVKQNKSDVYDFYFSDRHTGSIRKVTPEGMVVTLAGRGSPGLDGNHWGYVDGDLREEARFDQPTAIAWDESTATFYVGDEKNHRIRTITIEGESENEEENNEEENNE